MTQDQYSIMLTRRNSYVQPEMASQPSRYARVLRHLFLAVGLALLVTCLAGVFWTLNPAHLFGANSSRSLLDFFSLLMYTPSLLLLFLVEVALAFWLVRAAARPLARLAYLKAVGQAQETYRALQTPLPGWSYPYDVPIAYYQDDPDPTRPRQARLLAPLDLIEIVRTGTVPHLVLLGMQGAGKTFFLHEYLSTVAQRRREMLFGRFKLPVLVPLKYYALLLQELEQADEADVSLLDLLLASDAPGLHHLRPYLRKLFQQGHLLFLCDGLDEVPVSYRATLERELSLLFRQTRNHLLLTCTSELYEQSETLIQVVGENLVPRAEFQPLEQSHMRAIVERFITELDTQHHPQLPTAGQVMAALERGRLRSFGTAPFYLFALLDVIDTVPVSAPGRLDTRGRLLREFVFDRLASSSQAQPEDIFLLGDLACVARWNGERDLLRLPGDVVSRMTLETTRKPLVLDAHAGELARWLQEQPVYLPFATTDAPVLAEAFGPEDVIAIFQRTTQAGLIEIDAQGLLTFSHSLIASALLAEYLARYLGTTSLKTEAFEVFPDDLALWSEPLTLWAGLLEQPLAVAEELAELAREFVELRSGAIVLALICLGVAQTPPGVERQLPLFVPPALVAVLEDMLMEPPACKELAALFTRCVEQGSPELYQALFPLLEINRLESWLLLLDPVIVSDLFFQRLTAIIDDPEQEILVKRLVRALSSWGVGVIPRAARLSSASSNARLRTAAINVLGGTRAREAVAPLMACLRDPDQFIANRAAHALTRLGPVLTLPRLLPEMGTAQTDPRQALYWIILPILDRFLNETHPARQLTSAQYEQVIAALMALLQSQAPASDRERAQEILVSQGRLAAERESGKIAINLLVQNLATAKGNAAQDMTGTLKEVGEVATPHLLEQLERQTSEAERVRILEILTSVRDPRALTTLLRLLEDDSLTVQQALAAALRVHVPLCIPGLLEVILHHDDGLVALRAEQILSGFGEVVVEPVMAVLQPILPERTPLLVHVLECVQDRRAVPALIELLEPARSDAELILALIQAFGEMHDARVVSPLLDLLESTNPLLYEGAINALSKLGQLACPELLARLDVPEKTSLVARIERVLLGIEPFPAEYLLEIVEEISATQANYLAEVFLANGPDAAFLLTANLFHPGARVRSWVRRTLGQMDGHDAVPALLEVLNSPDPAWQELIASYLLTFAEESIAPLVGLLADPERAEAAVSILLQTGQAVFSALVPALDASGIVQARARHILATIVLQQPSLLVEVVQLFGLTLSAQVQEQLEHLLTEELAEISLPVLLVGLEDAHLVPGVSETLVRFARRGSASDTSVLESLLQSLRDPARRYGAALTLIELGSLAVLGVGALITDENAQVARSARHILGEIGAPAFPFLWAAHSDTSDPARREAAREIFRTMPTLAIKDELVALLTSVQQEDTSMALALLLERLHDESLQPGHASEMLPALLEHVQTSSDEQTSLRILALVLLSGSSSLVQALINALYTNQQGHERLLQAFLFLDQVVEDDLLTILRDASAPVQLQAEIAGILAMRTPQSDVQELARTLSEHGLWAGRSAHNLTTVLQVSQLEISLRALGGLLVAGHWNSIELQNLRANSKTGSAERELYDILLGWRYSPQLTRLEQELTVEREERRQELFAHTQELFAMKLQISDLEQEIDNLQHEYEDKKQDFTQRAKEFQDEIRQLTRQSQALQEDLREVNQEKLSLKANSQQIIQEREHLLAEKERWQTYGQQLEKEVLSLRRPKSNP